MELDDDGARWSSSLTIIKGLNAISWHLWYFQKEVYDRQGARYQSNSDAINNNKHYWSTEVGD